MGGKNPEEGRLTLEEKAEKVRQARKQTVEMRRQYRSMRNETEAKAKAQRWQERHTRVHEADGGPLEEMRKVSRVGAPLNRRGRRIIGKKLNVFKTPNGWNNFNIGYATKYGKREPFVKSEQVVVKSNIAQAMEAAKVTPKKGE